MYILIVHLTVHTGQESFYTMFLSLLSIRAYDAKWALFSEKDKIAIAPGTLSNSCAVCTSCSGFCISGVIAKPDNLLCTHNVEK